MAGVCVRVRVSRWCMAAHAGDGGSPISTVSAGEGLASHLCATSDAQRRIRSGMRVRLAGAWMAGVCVSVCRVGAWRHMLETAAARSQQSRRANAVRPILRHGRRPAPHWKRQGEVMCATCWRVKAGVWQSARVSRWCMAAHAGNGGSPISTVSAGKRPAPHLVPWATPSAALEAAG